MVLCVNLLIKVIFLRRYPQKNVEIKVKMKINSLSGQFCFGKQKRQNPSVVTTTENVYWLQLASFHQGLRRVAMCMYANWKGMHTGK